MSKLHKLRKKLQKAHNVNLATRPICSRKWIDIIWPIRIRHSTTRRYETVKVWVLKTNKLYQIRCLFANDCLANCRSLGILGATPLSYKSGCYLLPKSHTVFAKIAGSNWRLAHLQSASANSERYSSFNTLVASCAQLSKCIIVLLCACLSHSFSSRQSSLRPTPSGGDLQGCIQEPLYLYKKNKRKKVKGRQSGDRWHIWGRQGRESVSNP